MILSRRLKQAIVEFFKLSQVVSVNYVYVHDAVVLTYIAYHIMFYPN
jgi:hypothetical protein